MAKKTDSESVMGKVEKNIPLPDKKIGSSNRLKYDWSVLQEVGDSVLVTNAKIASIRSTAWQWKVRRELDWKFKFAQEENDVRVWRVA